MAAAVSRLLEHDGLPPAEGEVADGEAGDDGDAEPAVVGHEDEHDEVRQDHLRGSSNVRQFHTFRVLQLGWVELESDFAVC